jgi:hypothetical protein
VHDGPQPVTSLVARQKPLHECVPVGQVPEQAVPCVMQVPLHRVFPVGHEPPQEVPSQVAVPFCGTGHAVQAAPQLLVSSFREQVPPHRCCPAGQAGVTGASTGASTPSPAPPLPPSSPSGTSWPESVGLVDAPPVPPEPASAMPPLLRGPSRDAPPVPPLARGPSADPLSVGDVAELAVSRRAVVNDA